MLDLWVGLTNANSREIIAIPRVPAPFRFSYLNSEGQGNPVFVNAEHIVFHFNQGWAQPGNSNMVKGVFFSMEQDGYSFFNSGLKIQGLNNIATGVNFDVAELCFELIGVSEEERQIYQAMTAEKESVAIVNLQGLENPEDEAEVQAALNKILLKNLLDKETEEKAEAEAEVGKSEGD